jgi:hypothetical protein
MVLANPRYNPFKVVVHQCGPVAWPHTYTHKLHHTHAHIKTHTQHTHTNIKTHTYTPATKFNHFLISASKAGTVWCRRARTHPMHTQIHTQTHTHAHKKPHISLSIVSFLSSSSPPKLFEASTCPGSMALAQRRHWYVKLRSPMPMATYREADVCESALLSVDMYAHVHVCVCKSVFLHAQGLWHWRNAGTGTLSWGHRCRWPPIGKQMCANLRYWV